MDTIKLSGNKTCKMVAHRGLSGLEKENTIAAFVAAGNRSYFGSECDIHRTSDGRFVVIHDTETGGLAMGDNVNVEKSSFDLVRSVVFHDWWGDHDGERRKDLFIPSLEDYINVCKKYDKYCIIEIKGVFEEAWVKEVVDIIQSMNYLDHVIFIAFDLINLQYVRKILPTQPAQLLTGGYDENLLKTLLENKIDLDIYHENLTKERVEELHRLGIKVNCWTVNDKKRGEELLSYGVDYITTNVLE